MNSFLAPRLTGSATLVVLLTFAILSMIVGAVVLRATNNFHSIVQVSPWQEALLGAESGSDLGLAALRKSITDPANAWTGWVSTDADGNVLPDGARTFTPATLTHAGEGGNQMDVKVTVDAPAALMDASGRQWYRLRAAGTTYMPGSVHLGTDKRDHLLRRLSFVWDRKSGSAVARPQASRLVEIIAKPVSFQSAIVANGLIEMNNHQIVVDSYDSRSPAKSTNGNYDVTKRQQNADTATNGQIIEAGSAHIYGDVLTNAGVVTGAANVTGEQRTDFYQDLIPIAAPNWADMILSPNTVNGSATLTGGSKANPSKYKLSQINLTGGAELIFAPSAPGVESYVEVWVTGDMKNSGNGEITLQPNVKVKFYVEGNVDISGNGFINQTYRSVSLQLFGVQPALNTSRSIKVSGNGAFIGAIYAPGHDVTLSGGGSSGTYWGAVTAKTVSMNGHTSIHYDEAWADDGFISDYKIASWFEDNK